jgi:hypothetical protein
MAKDIKQAITRSRDTLVADAFGAAALMVILVGSLHLPSFL